MTLGPSVRYFQLCRPLLLQVTAKKDHRFEETGMFQQTIAFTRQVSDTTGTTDITNRWPIVAPRGTKARFTRRAEGYYQGGSQ